MASLVETVSGVARWAKSSVGAGIDAVTPSALTSGAIDVIVVEQADGSTLMCTPFHVRFGRVQVLRRSEKRVRVRVNGVDVDHVTMRLGAAGEAYFVERLGPEAPRPEVGYENSLVMTQGEPGEHFFILEEGECAPGCVLIMFFGPSKNREMR